MKTEPNWQPISQLPLIASMIDEQQHDAQRQYDHLLQAKSKPYVLDDETIARVIQVYTKQLELMPIYPKQLEKWKKEKPLSSGEQRDIQRLHEQVRKWEQTVIAILSLANELKEGTIDKVLSKDDFEAGLEALKKWSNGK